MPYRLQKEEATAAGLKRIAEEQLTGAVQALQSSASLDEGIYAARKFLKKARAILRLLSPQLGPIYQQENRRLRDVARRFSELRDSQVCLELLDEFAAEYKRPERLNPQRKELLDKRRALQVSIDWRQLIEQSLEELSATRKRIEDWPLRTLTSDSLAASFRRTQKDSRQAFDKANHSRTPEDFHEFRKSVKREFNQASLLFGKEYPVDAIKQLATLLGDHHNLAIFMADITRASQRFRGRLTRKMRMLEQQIIAGANAIYLQKQRTAVA